eukprot:scaffold11593_cov61-Phaeocystis_antarctica.AAC.9
MWIASPIWLARAAQAAGWPRLAIAPGSLRHDLALTEAPGAPADSRLSRLVLDTTRSVRDLGRHHPPVAGRVAAGGTAASALTPTLTLTLTPTPTLTLALTLTPTLALTLALTLTCCRTQHSGATGASSCS